jgi:glycosyltransferase involved in cell wall biosynthesis
MKVLIISQYFWPENFRINDLCSELKKRGHEVTVLTGKPNYPDGEVFRDYLNDPKKFNHYSGCDVIRVPMLVRGTGSSIKLMLNYLTFAFSATFVGAWKLRKKQFDIIFVFEPSPITVGLPAVFLKKLKKAPIVFWVLDLWPETLEAVGAVGSKRVLTLVGKLVSFIYNRCDLVLGQSRAFSSNIVRYCKNKSKIKYFPSWAEDIFSDILIDPVAEIVVHENLFKIIFAGNVGESQDFPAILQAARILKSKQVKAKFFIIGDGRAFEWVKAEIFENDLKDYICLLGYHPLKVMPSFYASADALLVSLKESPAFSMTIPGKVQSYMIAGKPILTMLSGEGSHVVEEAKCGYVANSGDYKQLVENIISMSELTIRELTNLGAKANQYAKAEFDRDKLIDQLESWFMELSNKTKVNGK